MCFIPTDLSPILCMCFFGKHTDFLYIYQNLKHRPSVEWDKLDVWFEDQEPWSDTVDNEKRKSLSAKEIKRQNTIHGITVVGYCRYTVIFDFSDLYITEKHHCQTLIVLKHVIDWFYRIFTLGLPYRITVDLF